MDSVQFKKNSGAATNTFDAVWVEVSYETDEERYIQLDFTRSRTVFAKWKVWTIRFGLLTTAQIDYLNELATEEVPQMIYATVTYNVEIEKMNVKYKGGEAIVINTAKET
jgi:hypothetical protein